jgi:uncharacterized damage-inducible protein DinB
MPLLNHVRRLFRHLEWADLALLDALQHVPDGHPAWREFSHILGAEAVWLDRLEKRAQRVAVWPELSREEGVKLLGDLHAGYATYLATLQPRDIESQLHYVNTAGKELSTSVGDILLHVAMHGQYHRGKINLMLRQGGIMPAPVDYVAFVRGVAAAVSQVGDNP